jgi:hypothetical protein
LVHIRHAHAQLGISRKKVTLRVSSTCGKVACLAPRHRHGGAYTLYQLCGVFCSWQSSHHCTAFTFCNNRDVATDVVIGWATRHSLKAKTQVRNCSYLYSPKRCALAISYRHIHLANVGQERNTIAPWIRCNASDIWAYATNGTALLEEEREKA